MKKGFCFIVVLCFMVQSFFAKIITVEYKTPSCVINFIYNDAVYPGDPVFVRGKIKSVTDKSLKDKELSKIIKNASITVHANGSAKRLTLANFYQHNDDILAAAPLNFTMNPDTYFLTISFVDNNTDRQNPNISIDSPLVVQYKYYEKETIAMGNQGTSVRSNTSDEKAKQSQKLSNVLLTTNTNSIWTTKAFITPVTSKRRTSPFGSGRVYTYTNGKSETSYHYGTDFGVPTGTPVYACADGKVVLAENRILTGWTVVIEHMPGLYSSYYHMDSLVAKEGDIVKQRQQIGFSGATGFVTGPHLHWEMRLLGTAINPDFFVDNPNYALEED